MLIALIIIFGIYVVVGLGFYALVIMPSMKEQIEGYDTTTRITHFLKTVFGWAICLKDIINFGK